jgi:hypothetical protein
MAATFTGKNGTKAGANELEVQAPEGRLSVTIRTLQTQPQTSITLCSFRCDEARPK